MQPAIKTNSLFINFAFFVFGCDKLEFGTNHVRRQSSILIAGKIIIKPHGNEITNRIESFG